MLIRCVVKLLSLLFVLSAEAGLVWPGPIQNDSSSYDLVIVGGRVMDGTGNPWFDADIGIKNGFIVTVGDLSNARATRTIEFDGPRRPIVAPGFIDLHSHADGYGADGLRSDDSDRRAALNLVTQGVTTVVVNQDGRSPLSIAQQKRELESKSFGPNAVLLVGHNTVRAQAMAQNPDAPFEDSEIGRMQRLATGEEIAQMRQLVRSGMEEGAYGMSAGLEYIPGRWSDTQEVISLVSEVAPWRGVFVEHERASGADPMWYLPSFEEPGQPTFLDSIRESIEIADATGVNVVATHAKARGADYWGSARAAVELIRRARARGVTIWADHYPYNTTGSDGSTRLIPQWVMGEREQQRAEEDYRQAVRKILEDVADRRRLETDIRHEINRRGGPENIVVMEFPDERLVGKTLADLMYELEKDAVETALHLQENGYADRRGGVRLRGYSLSEVDVEIYAAEPWMATASDAGIALPEDGFVHARFYGTFPRKIRKYAIERGVLSIEDAVRSATSLPAQILGFRNRGLLREGFHADIVVFDLETVRDRATFFEPHQFADGISHVLVGGTLVVDDGNPTRELSGQVITPEDGRTPPR